MAAAEAEEGRRVSLSLSFSPCICPTRLSDRLAPSPALRYSMFKSPVHSHPFCVFSLLPRSLSLRFSAATPFRVTAGLPDLSLPLLRRWVWWRSGRWMV